MNRESEIVNRESMVGPVAGHSVSETTVRFTIYDLRFTIHDSRFTIYDSRLILHTRGYGTKEHSGCR